MSDDLVGKRHADKTQKRWVTSGGLTHLEPEPCGALARFIGDLLEAWVDGKTELGTIAHAEVVKRCKRLKLNDRDVWNNVKALALLLPRVNQTKPADAGNKSGSDDELTAGESRPRSCALAPRI